MFEVGTLYSKKDIYRLLMVPEAQQRGIWDTGYVKYNGLAFIFANVGIAGRTGYNHGNHWDDNGNLVWFGKPNSHINQPTIQFLNDKRVIKHVFTRIDDRLPFTYEGLGAVKECFNTSPVKIIWSFKNAAYDVNEAKELSLKEGGSVSIVVNKYERNIAARRICIRYHGYNCKVCDFNFYENYGEIGLNYIHVHHIVPLHLIGEEYIVDPVKDLVPVCPNCHAMIHKKKEALSIEQLKQLLNKRTKHD